MNDPINYTSQALNHMADNGIEPPTHIEFDGSLHRYGKDKVCWYVAFSDDPVTVTYGDWRQVGKHTWTAKSDNQLTPAGRQALRERIKQAQQKEQEAKAANYRDAASRAAKEYQAAQPASPDHQYLQKKGIRPPDGIRQTADEWLIAPVYDIAGNIQTLQYISPTGDKLFLKGGKTKGGFFTIGDVLKSDVILICEGMATAASLFEATGHTTIAAMNAGNLKPVSEALNNQHQTKRILICADKDTSGTGEKSAQATGYQYVLPDVETKGDFNDMAADKGLEAVKQRIDAALQQPPPEATRQTCTNRPEAYFTGKPKPLPDVIPVQRLTPEMMPEAMRGFVVDHANRSNVPLEFVAVPLLIIFTSLVGRACVMVPKAKDTSWEVVPVLWGVIIGPPGSNKTGSGKPGLEALNRLNNDAEEIYNKDFEKFECKLRTHDIAVKALEKQMDKLATKEFEGKGTFDQDHYTEKLQELRAEGPEPPKKKRYQINDPTVETVPKLLEGNPRGLLFYRDELSGWLASFNKPGREGDRAFYLECWSGNGSYTVDRITRKGSHVDGLCLSVLGNMTPGPITRLVKATRAGGLEADGLLQRLQLAVWPDMPKFEYIDAPEDQKVKQLVFDICSYLAGDIPGGWTDDSGTKKFQFDVDGQKVFEQWFTELGHRLNPDNGLSEEMTSHLSKYKSLMPTLSLMFHLIDMAGGKIGPGAIVGENYAVMACAWCEYLESHAKKIYGLGAGPDVISAKAILEKFRDGTLQDGCKPKDIYMNHWSHLSTKEETNAGLEVLQDHDWLFLERVQTGGRPSDVIRLNPAIEF